MPLYFNELIVFDATYTFVIYLYDKCIREFFMKTSLSILSVRMATDIIDQLNKYAEGKKKNLSACLRYLIELGLRVEELTNTPNPEKKLEALVYKSCLENILLTRVLLRKNTELDDEDKKELLREASKTASETVRGYCGKDALDKLF